jgi:hypothetical protein
LPILPWLKEENINLYFALLIVEKISLYFAYFPLPKFKKISLYFAYFALLKIRKKTTPYFALLKPRNHNSLLCLISLG